MKNFILLLLLTASTFSFGQREIKDQVLILNNGTDRDVTIAVNLGLPGQPKLRYNVTTNVWEFSHDGTAWQTYVGLEYTDTQLALKAPLASPALTGNPTAPTAAAADNDTSIATTAFVQGELAGHTGDATDAHDASAISSVPAGNLAADDVQEAVNELQTDVDTRALDSALTTHMADTTTHGTTGNVVGTSDSQTLTNKTIDLDNNTLSNAEVDNLKSGVLDPDISTVSGSHDTLPSAKAVKDYVDGLDSANDTALVNHLTDTTDAHDASAISNVPSGDLTATDAQAALNEHQGDIDALEASVATNTSDIAAHLGDTVDAHDASAISVTPSGNLGADDVQEGLVELQGDINTNTSAIALKAADSAVVHLTGNETVAGEKTFTDKIVATSTTKASRPCPAMTTVQRDAVASVDNGACIWNTTAKTLQVYDSTVPIWNDVGSGSGVGGINYIGANYNAEQTTTTGWTCFDDAAAEPVDGTGGTCDGIALTNVASTTIKGSRLFRITKTGGAAYVGEGYAFPFTIDEGYQGDIVRVSLRKLASANFLDTDLRAYVYDITNSRLIHMLDNREVIASTYATGYIGSFQASINSTSYRLILVNSNSTAHTNGWTFDFDEIVVGPQTGTKGQQIDTQSSRVAQTASFGNTDITGALTTSEGAGIYSYASGTGIYTMLVGAYVNITATLRANGAASVQPFITDGASSAEYGTDTSLATAGARAVASANIYLAAGATFKIRNALAGTTNEQYITVIATRVMDNVSLSEDGGTRAVVMYARDNAGTAITANVTNIPFTTTVTDTTSCWNGSTCTIQEAGHYDIEAGIVVTATTNAGLAIYVDGSLVVNNSVGVSTTNFHVSAVGLPLVKGNVVSIRFNDSRTLSTSSANNYVQIAKRSSPQTLAGGASIVVDASNTSGQSIANNTAVTVTNWTETYDSNGIFDPVTGIFTADSAGTYSINGCLDYVPNSTTGYRAIIASYNNGTTLRTLQEFNAQSIFQQVCGSTKFRMVKGDTLRVIAIHTKGSSEVLSSSAQTNYLTIIREGN